MASHQTIERHPSDWRHKVAILVLLCLLAVAAFHLWHQSEQSAREHETRRLAEIAQVKRARVELARPEGKAAQRDVNEHATTVDDERISARRIASAAEYLRVQPALSEDVAWKHIRQSNFEPIEMQLGARSSPFVTALSRRLQKIDSGLEPTYRGGEQWYGYLRLGSPARSFRFVLDHLPGGQFEMWFDANANRDLRDDQGPLVNEGDGYGGPGAFATTLRIPWSILSTHAPFDGDFKIWFFSNEAGWKTGHRVSHYSRTQLRGRVLVNGQPHTAWLVDHGYNDTDLTNDGIYVDFNRDGMSDREEWIPNLNMIGDYAFAVYLGADVRW